MRKIIGFMVVFLSACTAMQHPLREDVVSFNQADNTFLRNHKKLPEVLPIYITLAEKGFTEAQFRLATIYDDWYYGVHPQDKNTDKNVYRAKAVYWYEKAAANGHPIAQSNLALWYGLGLDGILPKNEAKKFTLLSQAAQKGHATAQHNLAFMYHHGEYVAQDFELADFWYRKAILQNHEVAKSAHQSMLKDMAAQEKGTNKQ